MELPGRKIQRITLAVSFLFFGVSCNTIAQHAQERQITINMSASEMLPADQIIFNIDINAEAETPQKAFDMHKQRESVLANLLKEFEIHEDDINHEPIRINKRYRNGNGNESQTTVTNQSVSVTFSDFEIYEKIQVALIENNFDSFNGQFSSTKLSEGKDKALIKAIEAAKEKAILIAENSGIELGSISNINYSDHEIGFQRKAMSAYEMDSSASMMDFLQTVSVTANINISFGIE
ncbi:MAG: SIMPL domain-containing protein [Balneolaceae bacterium]